MKVQLISELNKNVSPITQVLLNRNINIDNINHYLHTTDEDISPPEALGSDLMWEGATKLANAIGKEENALIIVDSDCDGFTSAALLLNYLFDAFPAWTANHVSYFLHGGKQHGMGDLPEGTENTIKLLLIPDAGSNDYDLHQKYAEAGVDIVILDHHEADRRDEYSTVINNQMCDYPNKQASGVCVTWQFCRYVDSLMNTTYAENYLDLVALGLTGDMMSLTSIETKHLINKGFNSDLITNPYIYGMWQKNAFKLGDHITAIGAAFYIVPFINAICRSGTQEEKDIIFKSMIKYYAFNHIPSTKRGHKVGETERVIDQALRVSTNVKNRQTKTQDAGMAYLEDMIEKQHLLDHKVLLFLLEPGEVDRNIAGLIANKYMAKYQRPCCILTKVTNDVGGVSYQGSARGYGADMHFKDICGDAGAEFVAGHQGAFGLGLEAVSGVPHFIEATDEILKDMSSEPSYKVDYSFSADSTEIEDIILSLADYDSLWGQDMPEPMFYIHDVKIFANMITVMKGNTLKITLPNGIPVLKFNATEEEIDSITSKNGSVTVDMICRGNRNEWNGYISAQLMLVDMEIKKSIAWEF